MSETNGNGNGRRLNAGDLLHMLEIAVLLVSIGVTYAKFDAAAQLVGTHTQQLNRIEHYLSSKDPHYWDASRKAE